MNRIIKPLIATLITIFAIILVAHLLVNYPKEFILIFFGVLTITTIFYFWSTVFREMDGQ